MPAQNDAARRGNVCMAAWPRGSAWRLAPGAMVILKFTMMEMYVRLSATRNATLCASIRQIAATIDGLKRCETQSRSSMVCCKDVVVDEYDGEDDDDDDGSPTSTARTDGCDMLISVCSMYYSQASI